MPTGVLPLALLFSCYFIEIFILCSWTVLQTGAVGCWFIQLIWECIPSSLPFVGTPLYAEGWILMMISTLS